MRTIINAILITIIVTVVSSALTLYALAAYHTYEITEANWVSQNKCISHWISQGVERSDIYRDGGTCRVDRSFQ